MPFYEVLFIRTCLEFGVRNCEGKRDRERSDQM